MTLTFEEQVLNGINAVKAQQDTLLADHSRLSAESKSALEDLTRVKNAMNSIVETQHALTRLQAQLERERRMAFGNPIDRACAREEVANWLNGAARAVTFPGSMDKLPEALRKGVLYGADSGLGQATVPSEVAAEIYNVLLTYGQWNTLRIMRVGARTNTIPMTTALPTAYILGAGAAAAEGTQITEAAFSGGSVTLSIQTLAAVIGVSRELLQDSSVDMSAEVMRQLAQSVSYRLDWACFAADATADATDGGYRGLFDLGAANSNCVAEAAAGNTTVKELELEDFIRCLTTVSPNVLTRQAKWWIHPTILAKICGLKDANDRPLFQSSIEAPSPGAIGSILGYPVILTNAAPSTDAASAKVAVFGDPEGGVVGIRQDMELATADQWRFDYNEVGFRALTRAGFIIRQSTTYIKPFAVLTLPAA